jgi:hypothetical protein
MRTKHSWLACWITAALLAGSGWYAFERYWLDRGYTPTVMDSKDLWAQYRARVSHVFSGREIAGVALLGASRIQYGFSPRVFRDEVRRLGADVNVSMLAINGHYPLAALRDLANDRNFTGVAVVGVDARGFQKIHRDMQQKWVDYYAHEWTPAKSVHRSLLTTLQPYLISLRPDFSWSNLTARCVNGYGEPNREYVTFFADRSGGTDYSKSPVEAVRTARIRDLKGYYANTPAISPEQWLMDAEEVISWVRVINARGGRVVFYREPVSGEHLELDEARFPRQQFWDALASKMPATMIDFRDYPQLAFNTPDTSHIDAKDIPAHTRNFVRTLAEKGVFRGR